MDILKKEPEVQIAIPVSEYKRLLKIEQHMEVIKEMIASNKYFNNDDLKVLYGVGSDGDK